jgi:flagellar biosynthesis protein
MTAAPDPRKLAVALEYDRLGAPRVTAKGRGALAERILKTAREHDVPIEDDSLLAEALSRVPLDDEIPIELYRAVATVIGFILATQRKGAQTETEAREARP